MLPNVFTRTVVGTVLLVLVLGGPARAAAPDRRFSLFAHLTGTPAPSLIAYTPSQLDPRQDANQRRLATSSIRADLAALRPAFDGLILYGYHESSTPRILAVARDLKFRAVVLGIWDVKSAAEIDGVAELVRLHEKDFHLGVLAGNEGLTFKRYEEEDLTIAARRLRAKLPRTVPVGTSETFAGSKRPFVQKFGDFLAPNVHPVFGRPAFTPERAAAWAREEAAALAKASGKPVLLKETGFPHAGKEAYTEASQKAFWAAYLKPGPLERRAKEPDAWVFHGVAFEAFDLPWRAEESKLPIEKSWGLLSARRSPYPAFEVWREFRKREDGK